MGKIFSLDIESDPFFSDMIHFLLSLVDPKSKVLYSYEEKMSIALDKGEC